jgi:hypothetical protein
MLTSICVWPVCIFPESVNIGRQICMHVCAHVCMHVFTYACMCLCVHVCVSVMHVCVCIWTGMHLPWKCRYWQTDMYACMCPCMHACVCVCMYVFVYACTCSRWVMSMCGHIYNTHTHTQMYVSPLYTCTHGHFRWFFQYLGCDKQVAGST